MHPCHSCNALQPVEGERCTRCDAYLQCATAMCGDPSSFRSPAYVAPELPAPPSFRFTPRAAGRIPVIPRPEWTVIHPGQPLADGKSSSRAIARVDVNKQTYVLRATPHNWALDTTIQSIRFNVNDSIAHGPAENMQDAMVRAHQALVEQVTAEYCGV